MSLKVLGVGFTLEIQIAQCSTPIMVNQMDKHMVHEMETRILEGCIRIQSAQCR